MRAVCGVGLLCVVCLLPLGAAAEYYVCGDATRLTDAFYRDNSLPRAADCSRVPDDQVAQQEALVNGTSSPSVPRYHLKIEPPAPSGLAVEMTAAEKQAVDDARAAQMAEQQKMSEELTQNAFCSDKQLETITNKLAQRRNTLRTTLENRRTTVATGINNMTQANLASMKQMGLSLNDELYQMSMPNVVDDLYEIAERLTRCMLAARRTGG